jgi:hypothetical protein
VTERPIPQRLLDAATRSADHLRRLTEVGLRERFGDPTEVEIAIGQVWRARWEQLTVLVLVLRVADRRVEIVPVTIDPPVEDGRCVVVDGPSTTFGVDATAWAGLRTTVPIRVLDRLIDAWRAVVVDAVVAAGLGRPWSANTAVRPGRRIASDLDTDALFRAELADQVHDLADVSLLPASEQTEQQSSTLGALLGNRLDLGSLCKTLNMKQAMVMRVLHGKLPLQPAQVDLVAAATGLSTDEIRMAVRPLPHGLAAAAEHPRWRPTWTQRANRLRVTEAEAQLAGSYGVFALAARQTGGGEPDWNERLRHYFQDTSSMPDGT